MPTVAAALLREFKVDDPTLPDHAQAAVDGLRALPAAVLDYETPDYADSDADSFLGDAVRVFESVNRRLAVFETLLNASESSGQE